MQRLKQVWKVAGNVLLPVIILLTGVGSFIVFGQQPEIEEKAERKSNLPLVEVAQVQDHTHGFDLSIDGMVTPFRQAVIAAQVGGQITKKAENCQAGQLVQQDEFLLQINPKDYQLRVMQLRQELKRKEQAITELEQEITNTKELLKLADADLKLQVKELDRNKKLRERNVVSIAQYDQAVRAELNSRNNKQTLANQLALQQVKLPGLHTEKQLTDAKLKMAVLDLRRTKIRAPFPALISKTDVEQHNFVQPGQQLVLLTDIRKVEIKSSLRMDQLVWILTQTEPGETPQTSRLPKLDVVVSYPVNGTNYEWKGKLDRYEGVGVDNKTRTVPIRILVDTPGASMGPTSKGDVTQKMVSPALVSGMFVTIRVPIQPPEKLLSIPNKSLRPGNRVWAVTNGKLQIIPVTVVRNEKDLVIIQNTDQLSSSSQVVTSPLPHVEDGLAVQIQPPPITP